MSTKTGPAHFENGLAQLKPSSAAGRDNGPRTDQSVGPVPWSVRYTIKLPMPYIRPEKGPKKGIAIQTIEVSQVRVEYLAQATRVLPPESPVLRSRGPTRIIHRGAPSL